MSHPPTINATMMTKTMLMTMSCSSKIRDWLTGLAVAVNRFIMGPQLITSDLSLCRSDHLLIINTWSADKTRASSPIGGSSAMTSEIRDKLTGRSIALCDETLTDHSISFPEDRIIGIYNGSQLITSTLFLDLWSSFDLTPASANCAASDRLIIVWFLFHSKLKCIFLLNCY